MKELERINKKIAEYNLRLVIERTYVYDDACYMNDAYFEYFDTNLSGWRIHHILGKFKVLSNAIDAAKDWLSINHYKF